MGAGDEFGRRVAMDGNYVIIGAPYNDENGSNTGCAYIFDFLTGNEIHKLTASDAAASDYFGDSVAISGNYAIVGANSNDDDGDRSGSAYIFNVTTGTELHKLTASDAAAYDRFGSGVAIDGNYAIVGAQYDDSNKGAAYIFNVQTGAQLHKLSASDGAGGDEFGINVAISGNYAVVGAYLDDDNGTYSGNAFVFNVQTGTQLHKLTASNGAVNDYFGKGVAIDGNYVIVGADGNDENGSNTGCAYIFDVTTGTQLHKLTASDAAANDYFGYSVAISGNYAIVGSYGDDNDNGDNSGSAYIFNVVTGNEIKKITASERPASVIFGYGVAISGNYAIVGAKR